jgi:hypothetical protein
MHQTFIEKKKVTSTYSGVVTYVPEEEEDMKRFEFLTLSCFIFTLVLSCSCSFPTTVDMMKGTKKAIVDLCSILHYR